MLQSGKAWVLAGAALFAPVPSPGQDQGLALLSLNDLAPVLAFSDALGEALYALDREWRVAAANEAALRWLGSDAIVGRLYWDLVPGARGTVVETAFRSAMAGRERVDVEAESSVHPGRFARGVAIPLADGLAVSFRDVTEEHSARTERQHQLPESEERLRLATEAASIGTWDVEPACEVRGGAPTFRPYRAGHGGNARA